MCRDDFKIVLESNKCVVSRHRTFVGKCYDYEGSFHLSLLDDVCNKVVNNVIVSDESNIWHSRLCHINFDCLTRLANLNLILKCVCAIEDSKC